MEIPFYKILSLKQKIQFVLFATKTGTCLFNEFKIQGTSYIHIHISGISLLKIEI